MLMFIQILPVIIILFFAIKFSDSTTNAGWIFDERASCEFYTYANYENRSFIWSGTCLDGFAHGKGELTLLQNDYEYYFFEGTLSNGKIEGFGRSVMLDGDSYEGNYKDGLASGPGLLYNDDGDHYDGNFHKGLKSGSGTYWYEPESRFLKYAGEWRDNKENGTGTLFYRDGRKVSGVFKNGKLVDSL